ncbi:hypothetical protein HID58_094245, partial [Brassica napus]
MRTHPEPIFFLPSEAELSNAWIPQLSPDATAAAAAAAAQHEWPPHHLQPPHSHGNNQGQQMLNQLLQEISENGPSLQQQQAFQVRVVVATITQRETQLPPLPASQEEEEAEFQAETTVSKQSSQTTTIIICQKIYQSQNYLMISQKTPSSTTVIFMVACSLCNIPKETEVGTLSSLLFGMRFDICTW